MQTQYNKLFFSALFCLMVLCYGQYTFACGFSPHPNRYDITFFDAQLVSDPNYCMCHLDKKYFCEGSKWDAPLAEKHKDNVSDWAMYFKANSYKNATPDAIANLVYEVSATDLNTIVAALKAKKTPNSKVPNRLLQEMAQKKDLPTLQYLHYAKVCEPLMEHYYSWDEPHKDAAPAADKILQQGKIAYKDCPSDFLKWRYAFQMVRLARYRPMDDSALDLYDSYAIPLWQSKDPLAKKSILPYWVLARKAGSLYQADRKAESMYDFAQVFRYSTDQRGAALFDFEILDEASWDTCLGLAKNKADLATLWMARGLKKKDFDLTPLKAMHEATPKSALLNILLLREVSDIERQYLSPKTTQKAKVKALRAKMPSYLTGEDPFEVFPDEMEENKDTKQKATGIKGFFQGIWNWLKGLFGRKGSNENKDTLKAGFIALSKGDGDYDEEKKVWITEDTPPEDVIDYGYYDELHKEQLAERAKSVVELQNFVAKTAEQGNLQDAGLWFTVAAYLSYLQDDFAAADKLLTKVESKNEAVNTQALLVKSLVQLAQRKTIDTNLEADFYTALHQQKQAKEDYYNYTLAARVLTKIGQRYFDNKQVAKAILCFQKAQETAATNALTDFYASAANMDVLYELVSQKQPSDWIAFLRKNSPFAPNMVLDVKATKLMRQAKFQEALQVYDQMTNKTKYWSAYEANSEDTGWWSQAYGRFETSFTTPENQFQNKTAFSPYNKYTFAKEVVKRLGDLAQTKDSSQIAQQYFDLANGFSHTPYWGYNSQLWKGMLVFHIREDFEQEWQESLSYPMNTPNLAETINESHYRFQSEYGNRAMAVYFYKKALESTSDIEFAAKAAYWATTIQVDPHASFHKGQVHFTETIEMLQEAKYQNTEFFQEYVIRECPDFLDYLNDKE